MVVRYIRVISNVRRIVRTVATIVLMTAMMVLLFGQDGRLPLHVKGFQPALSRPWKSSTRTRPPTEVKAKSRMPSFSPEEQAELERMMQEYKTQSRPQAAPAATAPGPVPANTPTASVASTRSKSPSAPSSSSNFTPQSAQAAPLKGRQTDERIVRPILAPNADWRSALTNPYRPVSPPPKSKPLQGRNARLTAKDTTVTVSNKKPVSKTDMFDDLELDLDYDDVEAAMLEIELGGYHDIQISFAPLVYLISNGRSPLYPLPYPGLDEGGLGKKRSIGKTPWVSALCLFFSAV